MLEKYRILISSDNRYLFFVGDNGQILPVTHILNFAESAGCSVKSQDTNEEFSSVTFLTVTSDKRFIEKMWFIVLGHDL